MKKDSNGIICEDTNIKPELYNKSNIEEYYKKYDNEKKYTYVYVEYLDTPYGKPYSYITDKEDIHENDIVKVERSNNETYGRVVKIEKYNESEVPYPIDKMKYIKEIVKDKSKLSYNNKSLSDIHSYGFENEKMLKEEQVCGCYYCCRIFNSSEIEEWVDDIHDGTAICPYCGVDSIIGEKSGVKITNELLEELHNRWF